MEDAVIFRDSQENKLTGMLLEVSKSIVILCHGFRSNKMRQSYTRLVEELTSQGVSTFRFDFYAHGASDGEFEDLTVTKLTDGLLAAVEMLKEMGFTKVGVFGASMGGICAMNGARQTDDIQYLALKSPVSDWYEVETRRRDVEEWKKAGYTEMVNKEGEKYRLNYSFLEDAKKNIAYDWAPKIKVPVLIVHGDEDETVPLEQSQKICKLLSNCKLEIIEGANHYYSESEHKEQMVHLIVDFIVEQAKQ